MASLFRAFAGRLSRHLRSAFALGRLDGGGDVAAASKNYEATWSARLTQIHDVIGQGETELPRVLALVARRTEQIRKMDLGRGRYVAFDMAVELPSRGAQKLHRGSIVEAVIDLCSPDTQAVVELGSGWGEHLCNIWASGGPRDATYYACEITESGRECARVLAGLERGLRLEAPYFDYLNPDFSAIPRGHKDVVVYSVHSIEQVRDIPMELITRLCRLADSVKVAHFEPVGWQMIDAAQKTELTRRHEARCDEKRYNRNFWALLRQAEADHRIQVRTAIPNFFGLEHNPTSYIVWEKTVV
jgi:hypothetical protein